MPLLYSCNTMLSMRPLLSMETIGILVLERTGVHMSRILCVTFLLSSVGCAMLHQYKDADIPAAHDISEVMWAQKQATDPAFNRIGQSALSDADYTIITRAGERLKLTAPRLKEKGFSKGVEFDAFADALLAHGEELVAAASAKDAVRAQAALAASKETCANCHKKFR